ncbi:MAG: c-type cytochrome [Rubrivivax sp.]|nr:c-type cytochrome [Rubrivivax sp.]
MAGMAAAAAAMLVAAVVGWVAWRNVAGQEPVQPRGAGPESTADAALAQRGAYLARAGNCQGCHTRRGGAPNAGGRAIATPFGAVYSSNLTPDDDTGLGRWSASEFWRAMHHGRSRDGRLLVPAFPYPNFTRITREDSDALFAWLRTLPPVREPQRAHELRFPYNLQPALAVWRALYFTPGVFVPEPGRSAAYNRGSYLVNGIAHCMACHAPRNALGATREGPGEAAAAQGSLVSAQNWYAPSLSSADEAGVAHWNGDEVVALLRTGVAPRGWVMGPMAEVVFRSTQHLNERDLRAIAEYLRALPQVAARATVPQRGRMGEQSGRRTEAFAAGAKVYEKHCAACHGGRGEGADGYLALAGNRAVTMASPHNVIKAIRDGGFAPTTLGNPQPMGMPPFHGVLGDEEIAAVASFIRQAWGHGAAPVQALDVLRAR